MARRKDALAVGARALRRVFSLGEEADRVLRERAEKSGLSDSEVVRRLILGKPLDDDKPA